MVGIVAAVGFPFWGPFIIEHPRERVLPLETLVAFDSFGPQRGYRSQGSPFGLYTLSERTNQGSARRVYELAQLFTAPADGVLKSIEVAVRTLRAPVKFQLAIHADTGDNEPAEPLEAFVLLLPDSAASLEGRRVEFQSKSTVPLVEGYTYWVVASGISGEGAVWQNAEPLRTGGSAVRLNGGKWRLTDKSWRFALRVVMETRPKR